mmetsp:Transcript_24171/g.75356  ORF Transcript_24171/g.75356 Transcript_24171/m.75356 type:complete len:239 (-) Transcript_24171:1468-2184(-)
MPKPSSAQLMTMAQWRTLRTSISCMQMTSTPTPCTCESVSMTRRRKAVRHEPMRATGSAQPVSTSGSCSVAMSSSSSSSPAPPVRSMTPAFCDVDLAAPLSTRRAAAAAARRTSPAAASSAVHAFSQPGTPQCPAKRYHVRRQAATSMKPSCTESRSGATSLAAMRFMLARTMTQSRARPAVHTQKATSSPPAQGASRRDASAWSLVMSVPMSPSTITTTSPPCVTTARSQNLTAGME